MGHSSSVSRLIGSCKGTAECLPIQGELEKVVKERRMRCPCKAARPDRDYIKYKIFIILLLFQSLQAGEVPVLRFDDRVTWKHIFDAGFRPKHYLGLESSKCVIPDQSFLVEFKGREPIFKVEEGRVSFSFYHDDFLSMVWHQGYEAISLEEGRKQADLFHKVFDGYITQEMTMPRLIDPSGLVDAGNDKNNIKAQVGEYLTWYGFDNSMRADKPLIPHFYIAWNFRGMPSYRTKNLRDFVRPPKGYEWYSLDPKVHTPDPVSTSEALPEVEIKARVTDSPDIPGLDIPKAVVRKKSPENPEAIDEDKKWVVWLVLAGILVAVALYQIRRLICGILKPK